MEDVEVGDDCGAEFREPLSAVANAGNFESVIRKTVSMFSFFLFLTLQDCPVPYGGVLW